MELAADRGFDVEGKQLYEMAEHFGGLADLITTVLRERQGGWERPEDVSLPGGSKWSSASFLAPEQTFLRRVVLASRWSRERKASEQNSYFSLFEACIYQIPVRMTVMIIGQLREGKHYSGWTRASRHPVNKKLRFRFKPRKDSQYGANWEQVWRESVDTSRDAWLDAMREDGVMADLMFDVEVPVPIEEVRRKVIGLAERRLREIEETTETPAPSPSQCFYPTKCPYSCVCWQFRKSPTEQLGFVRIG